MFLTVNVVGASSPEPDGVTVSSFGQILHTPPLLAEAGQPVELSYDLVCGLTKDEPGETCSPKGSVFVRASGTNSFVEHTLEREPDGLLSAEVPVGSGGFDYYAELDNGRGESASSPGGCRCPAARLAGAELDDGRPGSGTLRRDEVALIGRLGSHRAKGARRSGSTPARSSRGSGRRHSTLLQTAPSSCSTR